MRGNEDARLFRLYEGASQIHQLTTAELTTAEFARAEYRAG